MKSRSGNVPSQETNRDARELKLSCKVRNTPKRRLPAIADKAVRGRVTSWNKMEWRSRESAGIYWGDPRRYSTVHR